MSAVFRSFRGVNSLRWSGLNNLPVGSTKNTGTPEVAVRRRVLLHEQNSGVPLTQLWSNATTGEYQFKAVKAGTYFVIAFDHTGTYSAESESDIVVPEPPPAP